LLEKTGSTPFSFARALELSLLICDLFTLKIQLLQPMLESVLELGIQVRLVLVESFLTDAGIG